MHRASLGTLVGARDGGRDRAEPALPGGRVVDAEEDEPRREEIPVAARDEPLHVVHLGRRAHSACTQRWVASSSSSPRSPARIRSLLPALAHESRPYAENHTRVGTWCRRR